MSIWSNLQSFKRYLLYGKAGDLFAIEQREIPYPSNYPTLVDFKSGIDFGKFGAFNKMKLRLSHKDYLLAFGILVAVIVMLTTLVYTEVAHPESKNREVTPQRKSGLHISPSVILKKAFEKVDFKALASKTH